VTEAEKKLIDAEKALQAIDTNDYQDKIDDARTKMTDAKTELDDAQEEFDKYKDLDAENATRKRAEDDLETAQNKYDDARHEYELLQNALDQARNAVTLAQANLDDLRTQADNRRSGPDPDDLALAQSRLANSEAQLAAAQAALDNMDLVAPYDGTIVEVNISANERANPSVAAFVIADLVDRQTDDLGVALGELVGQPGHVAQLGRADRRVVLRMGEQDGVAVADPVMESDWALRRFCREIRRNAADG
jgi:multidrug resistance efflux pump